MVSKAREDLPEPESPVITVKRSRGMSTLMFFRLCWRAPLTLMRSMAIAKISHSSRQIFKQQADLPAQRRKDAKEARKEKLGFTLAALPLRLCARTGLEIESQPEFHSPRRLSRRGLAKEG